VRLPTAYDVQIPIGIEKSNSDISELVKNWPFSNKSGNTATHVPTKMTVARARPEVLLGPPGSSVMSSLEGKSSFWQFPLEPPWPQSIGKRLRGTSNVAREYLDDRNFTNSRRRHYGVGLAISEFANDDFEKAEARPCPEVNCHENAAEKAETWSKVDDSERHSSW
jgi:hypothetical protein